MVLTLVDVFTGEPIGRQREAKVTGHTGVGALCVAANAHGTDPWGQALIYVLAVGAILRQGKASPTAAAGEGSGTVPTQLAWAHVSHQALIHIITLQPILSHSIA